MGSTGIAHTFLTSTLDESGQLHAPVALPPAKGPRVTTVQEAGRDSQPV
jgi:hypothetical protein